VRLQFACFDYLDSIVCSSGRTRSRQLSDCTNVHFNKIAADEHAKDNTNKSKQTNTTALVGLQVLDLQQARKRQRKQANGKETIHTPSYETVETMKTLYDGRVTTLNTANAARVSCDCRKRQIVLEYLKLYR
jgi:hypothetical protein